MKKNPTSLPSILISLFTLFSLSTAIDTIALNQSLADGQTLISSGDAFALGFFSPSTANANRYLGIWYNKIKVRTVVWVANRRNPIHRGTNGTLTVTNNGTLIILSGDSNIIWSSTPSGGDIDNPVVQLLNTGNLVVRESTPGERIAWESFDYPTDSLLPGMKLGWDLTRGLNRNLTAWRSNADPSPGEYSLAMDVRGDPQLTGFKGSTRRWRSGPWNGIEFNGIPAMVTYTGFAFQFVDNESEVYYSYNLTGSYYSTLTTRLMVNETGFVQRQIWVADPGKWVAFWYAPQTTCGEFSSCGPYGICDPNASPVCRCVTGFAPKSPAEWALGDGSAGCTRKTVLSCRVNTTGDGFLKVGHAKLPDTAVATVDRGMGLEECRAVCAANCSCTGYASADVRNGGSGCIIWSTEILDLEQFFSGGQDFYVRLAAADLANSTSMTDGRTSRSKAVIIAVVTVISGVFLLLTLIVIYQMRKKTKRRRRGVGHINGQSKDESTHEDEDLELPLFDLGTVMAATNDFSDENKLGEGSFGPVYKGDLGEGREIAVKRLSKTSIQGIDEFRNEVKLIAKLQHRNLVRLLGYCIQSEEEEWMLIYEYMQNKSLDIYLFEKAKEVYLDWQTRFHIILGIARGILYLHEDSRFRIIHRDLKASNILLDKEMNPKISDFGLARIFRNDEDSTKTKTVVGTYGYMSPEYAMAGIFSVKSDVFSFGVLLLEIISGQKNRGVYLAEPNLYLLGKAWSLWKEEKSIEIIDPSIGYSFSMTEVMRCIKVGLLCVQESAEDRPTMSSVVYMLSSDSAQIPEPKQPGFVAKQDISSKILQNPHTANGITITTFEGR